MRISYLLIFTVDPYVITNHCLSFLFDFSFKFRIISFKKGVILLLSSKQLLVFKSMIISNLMLFSDFLHLLGIFSPFEHSNSPQFQKQKKNIPKVYHFFIVLWFIRHVYLPSSQDEL